jgi:hypothetical protein
VTSDTLLANWSERDHRYASRPPLTEYEEAIVRQYRRAEAERLQPGPRRIALDEVRLWTPPVVLR